MAIIDMATVFRIPVELSILFGRACSALTAVAGGMAFASYLLSSPVDATPRMDAESGAIWTSVPVRVDPKHQPYQREPDRYPIKFSAGPSLEVLDNATFLLKGDTYVIVGVSRIAPRALCVDARGRRLACGQNAAGALRTALRRSFMECSRSKLAPRLFMATCRREGQDLAGLLRDASKPRLLAETR